MNAHDCGIKYSECQHSPRCFHRQRERERPNRKQETSETISSSFNISHRDCLVRFRLEKAPDVGTVLHNFKETESGAERTNRCARMRQISAPPTAHDVIIKLQTLHMVGSLYFLNARS